ncbi:MAG: universal stress protein [Planctomycetes bacterium]|jgi:nucleotide-binding universal stress UspA family protein|nr:universal stress protein [Planctomycetota bacterium]
MTKLTLGRILVPTDFSPPSRKALGYAAELARVFGGVLILLHVIDRRVVENIYHIHALPPEAARAEMRRAAEAKLSELLASESLVGVSVTTRLVEGIPSVEIRREAGEGKADLVVIGSHGATGLSQLLYGSTAEGVVRGSPCPVLTVNP